MNVRCVVTIYTKELLELVRDRRTLISMVAVPVLAIPAIFLVMNSVIASREKQAASEAMTVAVESRPALAGLREALAREGFSLVDRSDLRAAVESKAVPAAVEVVDGPDGQQVRLYLDRTRPSSQVASEKLATALDRIKTAKVKAALAGSGLSESVLTPFRVEKVNVAPQRKMAGFFMGSMIGYMVILLMFTGAMYPAIDMTAGEKERRTLEILLASPAGRQEIVLGKILAASTASFLTALLNVMSMAITFRFGPNVARLRGVFGSFHLDGLTIALVLLAVLPTAVTAASLMIAVSVFAKSFKEGQSYLTPVLMLVIFPAIVGILPGSELNTKLAWLPVFNVSQLIKAIFQGEYTAAAFGISFAANFVYAAIAFLVAVRVFSRESVLFRI